MHPGCGQHPRPRDSDWAACQTRASPHTLAVRCGHDLGAPGPRGRHGVLAGPSSGLALPQAVRAQDCQHPPSPCASCIGPWQPKSTAGERGACRLCLQDRELARHSLLCHWRTRAARQACEVRGHPTPGTGKSVGCPGRHGGGTCSLSAGGEEQEALGGGGATPHHQASTGQARVCWGPDSTEQRSGQRPREGCFRTRELVLGSGHRGADGRGLCHLGGCPGSTGSRGAPRRPRGWQPAHGPPHRPPLPPAWFQEVEHVRKQSPQSLTGHGCAPVPSARRRGAGARPRR